MGWFICWCVFFILGDIFCFTCLLMLMLWIFVYPCWYIVFYLFVCWCDGYFLSLVILMWWAFFNLGGIDVMGIFYPWWYWCDGYFLSWVVWQKFMTSWAAKCCRCDKSPSKCCSHQAPIKTQIIQIQIQIRNTIRNTTNTNRNRCLSVLLLLWNVKRQMLLQGSIKIQNDKRYKCKVSTVHRMWWPKKDLY